MVGGVSVCRRFLWFAALSFSTLFGRTAAYAASTPTLQVATPATTSFPVTTLGKSSAAQVVQLSVSNAITIASVTVPLTVNSKQEFVVGTVTGCATDGKTATAAGSVCSVSLTFAPGYSGLRQQPLLVTDSTGLVYSFGLKGTGAGPHSLLQPASVATTGGASGGAYYSGDAGPIASARFGSPYSIVTDAASNVYIADYSTGNVRVLYQSGAQVACLIEMENPLQFGLLTGATSCAGATSAPVAGNVYTLAGDQTAYTSSSSAHNKGLTGDGGPAGSALLNAPAGLAVDASGNIVIGDYSAFKVRVIYQGGDAMACLIEVENPTSFGLAATATSCSGATSAPTPGFIYTLGGTGTAGVTGDGAKASAALFATPLALALSPDGDIYIVDASVQAARTTRIRVIYAGGATTASLITLENPGTTPVLGNIYKIAGGVATETGDGALASAAGIQYTRGVALDADGDVYFGDYSTTSTATQNVGKVRVIYAGGAKAKSLIGLENAGTVAQPGFVYTIAGSGATGYSGDGGLATAAQMLTPYGLALDPAGDIYVGESSNYVVRKISSATGLISTFAGIGTQGVTSGNAFTAAQLWSPYGIAFTASGLVYFTDPGVYRIRSVSVGTASLTFPAVVTAGSYGATQTLVHTNVGTDPLTISSVVASTDFAVVASGSTVYSDCRSGTVLQSGQSCAVGVAVYPTQGGTLTGTLTVTDNSLNVTGNTHVASLTGSGTAKVLSTTTLTTSASPVDFGKAVTFTATATPAAGTTSTSVFDGTVTFTSGTATLATITLSNGVAVYTTTTLPSGTQTIVATYSGNAAFQGSSASVSEVVIPPSYTVTATSLGVAVTTGKSVTDTFQVATAGGYAGTMTASCGSGLPPSITCSFAPSSLTFTGADDTKNLVLTIGTTGATAALTPTGSKGMGVMLACLLGLPAFGLAWRKPGMRRYRGAILPLTLLMLGALGSISGCGNGKATAPTGTFNLNVILTDGSTTSTIPVTVSVTGTGWQQ